jgi:hypothetical protein
MLAFTDPSSVPTMSSWIGTSSCLTSVTRATGGGAGGDAFRPQPPNASANSTKTNAHRGSESECPVIVSAVMVMGKRPLSGRSLLQLFRIPRTLHRDLKELRK